MPIFEYVCDDCSEKYDKLVRSRTAKIELKCPKCGSTHGKKALSAFSAHTAGGAALGMSSSSGPSCGAIG